MPSSSANRLALPITLLVLAAYLALLPWTSQVWLRTGDEPHYLVAADSLVRDGDLDLRNNYNPQVFLDWYASPNLNPQVKTRADGAQFLIHTYGLALLIAPAYWLAGARGVAYFMALLGAVLAGQVYLLALRVSGDWRAAAFGALVVAFAPPMIWYVYLLYPELPGALCVTVAARMIIDLTPLSGAHAAPPAPLPVAGRGEPNLPIPVAGRGEPDLPIPVARRGEHDSSLPVTGRREPVSPLPFREGGSLAPPSRYGKGAGGLGLFALALCLAALPWLSARFIPAALVLAGLAVIGLVFPITNYQLLVARLLRAWPVIVLLAISLLGLAWFNAAHYGSGGVAASYTSDIDPGPVSAGMLLQVTRGVLGWLLDHQRGLLIAGPIYLVAFIGLGQWLWRREWGAVVVGLPFAAALGATALIGGFWVGIEPGARYLVYVLPPLGASLAYAWVHRRGPWLAVLTAATLAASLWTAAAVMANPLLAQTHDLIGEQAAALVPLLPALGKPVFIAPGAPGELAVPLADPPAQPAAPVNAALWHVPAGQAGAALQQPAINDLPFGWYTLQFSLGAAGAPADAPVARVLLQTGQHQPMLDTMLYGRDFDPGGALRAFQYPVFNDNYNQWEQPAGLWIFTTGRADLTLSAVALPPDPFHSLALPGLWLAGLALVGAVVATQYNAGPAVPALPRGLGGWWPVALACAALALGVGAWSLRPLARQYGVADLANLIGTRVSYDSANGGPAISTAGDEQTPGPLALSRPEFWPAGRYRWTVSLKAGGGAASGAASPATLIIHAPRQAVPGFPAQVVAGAVPADGKFHTLAIEFDNPARQALTFELDATGAAPLETGGFEIEPLR